MAVSGAFVFAAQMINFTIPGTGSSGHIGGGILLAALLGPAPALLTLTAVLAVQALFFADGGLLALGCNIFNMGVIPCLVIYPLVIRPFLRKGHKRKTAGKLCAAGVMIALPLGAFFVVLETLASGITALPFSAFTLLMVPIHGAIAVGEALVTAAVVSFVDAAQPEILESAAGTGGVPAAAKKVLAGLGLCALVTGGLLSLFASAWPDGLEWSIEKLTGSAELKAAENKVVENAEAVQNITAFMPGYEYRNAPEGSGVSGGFVAGTSAAGIAGSLITCIAAGGAGLLLYTAKKRKAAAERSLP
jgi:cobalt/nickel transport system permease protein